MFQFKTLSLLNSISQFGKGIAKFQAAYVKLKSFCNGTVIRFQFCQGGAGSGIIIKKKRFLVTQVRFDLTGHYFIKPILKKGGFH